MEDLQQKIIELMDLFDDEQVTTADKIDRPQSSLDREAFDDFNKRNPMMDGGMLVQPSADGSRPGYADQKPLTKREQNILNNYLKARKNMKLGAPKDMTSLKSKVRVGTIDNDTIKNMNEKFRYEYENQRLRYDTKLKRWEKTAGRDQTNYIQKKGETKSEFLKRVANITSRSTKIARKKQDTATIKARTYIDNWTKNWLDNNLEKYGVRDFDNMTADLKKDWQKNVKTLKMDKGFLQSWSTKSGLPNVTADKGIKYGLEPFNYNGTPFYTSVEVTKAPLSQWRGLFFKNKIDSSPQFKQKILDYFNFINTNKRGLYMQEGGQTIKAYKDIVDKDVLYLLSPDANLLSSAKYSLFNSIDDEFSEAYNTYTAKVNRSEQWKKSAALIEKTLGLKPNYIKNSMKQEQKAIAKLFDLKQLPEELRYTLEHAQGVSAAAKTGNKEIMQRAVNDLIGTTIKQNKALGFGGFEQTRNALIRDITAGVNVKDNLNSLNQLTANAYKDFGIKDKVYSLQDGQLTSKNISPATTREERFAQYFKEIDKTKEGSAAIKKRYGTLENLLAKIGCPGKGKVAAASGGRIQFQDGLSPEVCMTEGAKVIKEKRIDSPAQKANFNKMMKIASVGKNMALLKDVLGPYGLAGDVLLEGMIAVNKTLTGGTPFKESWQDSWLSNIAGGAYDEKGEKLGRQKLFELRSGLSSGAQELGDYNRKIEEYYKLIEQKNNLEAMSGGGAFDYVGNLAGDVRQINNKIKIAERELGRMETRINAQGGFEVAQNEFNRKTAERQDADAATSLQSIGRQFVDANQLNEMLQDDFSDLSSDALPMQRPDRTPLKSYMDFKPDIPTVSKLKEAYQEVGIPLPSDDVMKQDINQERFRQLFKQPGFMGASDTFFGDSINMADGGRAGFKVGSVRKGVLSLIDESLKKTPKDTTSALDKLIKKTLNEDLFDKKDRIIDSINISEAKKRRNYPYNIQVFEEPKNLDFYDAITKSNFRTKTGPYFDRIRKNKAGGGLLKQAGDRSGPPPESGPNSQGLQGLLNRDKKI